MRIHQVEFRVRYAETDQMGVVHHSQYFVYFEIGRTEFLRTCGLSYRELEEKGILLAIARVTCRFRAPARYDDVLRLDTWVERFTAARIDHAYKLWRNDGQELVAEATTTLACLDRDGKQQPMPKLLIDLMERNADTEQD